MADFGPAIACLTGTYVAFITQETAKLTSRIASVVASFTDPLEQLAETNVDQLVEDVADLTSGDIAGNLASMGAAIIVTRVKRELNDILKDVIKRNPGVGDAIQRITNISEAVYGVISLAVMLRKEAPYSAVKYLVDEANEILTVKENTLNCMRSHIVQLNNAVQATANNPTNTAASLKADFAKVSTELGNAASHLVSLEYGISQPSRQFIDKEYNQAVAHLNTARSLVSPTTDTNLLDISSAVAVGMLGTEFMTDAQVKMASFSVLPIAITLDAELSSVIRCIDRINNYVAQIPQAVPDYEAASESTAMKEFRSKLLSQLRIRIQQLKSDIDAALTKDSLDSMALNAMSWSARLNTIVTMTPQVKNQLSVGLGEGERVDKMQSELNALVSALSAINGKSVTSGLEDHTALKAQIGILVNQAKTIMTLSGTGKIDNFMLSSFQQSVNIAYTGSASAISDSLAIVSRLRNAFAKIKTLPSASQSLEQLLSLLDLLGLDRAKDLLKLGKFKDFLNTTIDDASYIGLAIKCLISVEEIIDDSVTLSVVSKLKSILQGQKLAELSAAFDILDSGKNAAILEITNKLSEGQANLEKVQRVIETLKSLAAKAGESVSQIQQAAEGLGDELGGILTGPGGALNEHLANVDVPGLQSGCLGQVKF